jgi:hypothetical protein
MPLGPRDFLEAKMPSWDGFRNSFLEIEAYSIKA